MENTVSVPVEQSADDAYILVYFVLKDVVCMMHSVQKIVTVIFHYVDLSLSITDGLIHWFHPVASE